MKSSVSYLPSRGRSEPIRSRELLAMPSCVTCKRCGRDRRIGKCSCHCILPSGRCTLWKVVGKRLRALNVSLPHYGPHALRHACATRLLAAGLSLKEIGDQLGHTDPDSTRIYAKVDLAGLRRGGRFRHGRCPMNLQRLIEQYISYQQSLGLSFRRRHAFSELSAVPVAHEPTLRVFGFSMWMRSWAKPGQ